MWKWYENLRRLAAWAAGPLSPDAGSRRATVRPTVETLEGREVPSALPLSRRSTVEGRVRTMAKFGNVLNDLRTLLTKVCRPGTVVTELDGGEVLTTLDGTVDGPNSIKLGPAPGETATVPGSSDSLTGTLTWTEKGKPRSAKVELVRHPNGFTRVQVKLLERVEFDRQGNFRGTIKIPGRRDSGSKFPPLPISWLVKPLAHRDPQCAQPVSGYKRPCSNPTQGQTGNFGSFGGSGTGSTGSTGSIGGGIGGTIGGSIGGLGGLGGGFF
jgi:hypothetical protein